MISVCLTASSINHTDLPILCASVDHLSKVLTLATNKKIPTLKYLVAMDKIDEEAKKILVAWGAQLGIKVTDICERKCCDYICRKPTI